MKLFASLVFLLFISATCHRSGGKATGSKQAGNTTCYKARLEIKGICMNYVIKVLEGDLNALAVEKEWTDESDGKRIAMCLRWAAAARFRTCRKAKPFILRFPKKKIRSATCAWRTGPCPMLKTTL
jgi:hypothetical protein